MSTKQQVISGGQFEDWSGAAFVLVCALIFAVTAAWTMSYCGSMPEMAGMKMPGGWTMSMIWMRMPGESWWEAASSFTGMWAVMMMAMMLPSLTPTLWRYRNAAVRAGTTHAEGFAAILAAAYFLVWMVSGAILFPLGAALAAVEMRRTAVAQAVPAAAGMVVLIAGLLQFTPWKAHHLACCREAPESAAPAWEQGLRLGLHCIYGCMGWTAILLVAGVMDLRAMALVTAAITAERVAPEGERVARVLGAAAVMAGLLQLAPF